MRKTLQAGIVTLGAAALILPAMPAHAADTIVTFTLAAGPLTITAPPATALVQNLTTGVATGIVTPVAVTDLRLSTAGWISTAASTDFTGPVTIPKAKITYTPTTAIKTGIVTVTAAGAVTLDSAKAVQTATAAAGSNTATWSGDLSVDITNGPTTGIYTATLTHSVA